MSSRSSPGVGRQISLRRQLKTIPQVHIGDLGSPYLCARRAQAHGGQCVTVGAAVGSGRNVRELLALQTQERALQPAKRDNGQRERDCQSTQPKKRPAMRVMVSGKKMVRELQAQKVIGVKPI